MKEIDAAKAAQVWQRVLAGREGFVADRAETPRVPELSGDLPPVRTVPPGLAGWNTYAVFPDKKQSQPTRGGTFPSPILALLFALLVLSGQAPKTHHPNLPKKIEKDTLPSPSA